MDNIVTATQDNAFLTRDIFNAWAGDFKALKTFHAHKVCYKCGKP